MMIKLSTAFSFAMMFMLSASVNAWVTGSGTVDEVWVWQKDVTVDPLDVDKVYFKFSNNTMCYINSADVAQYSLILSLHATGKTADYYCWDTEENTQSILGHKLHRLISK